MGRGTCRTGERVLLSPLKRGRGQGLSQKEATPTPRYLKVDSRKGRLSKRMKGCKNGGGLNVEIWFTRYRGLCAENPVVTNIKWRV